MAVPGSPTFTNPDMILPGYGDYREAPSPPVLNSSLQRQPSLNGGKRRSLLGGLGPRLPVVGGNARPSLLGAWQTENATSDPNSLTRRTSVRTNAEPGYSKRLSRTPSLRSSRSWQRTPSVERLEPARSHSSLLGSGHRRPSLAERLDEDDEDAPDSPYTTTSESTNADEDDISTQAEEILANAKKRLTAMEGNLSRARSVSLARSGSAASNSGDSGRLSRRISRSTLGAGGNSSWSLTSSKMRQAPLSNGHLRVSSEVNTPVTRSIPSPIEQRSWSALGHGAASGSPGLRTEWTDTSSSDSYSNGLPRHLEALPEDELASTYQESISRASPIIRQQLNAATFYHSPASSTSTLSRARSSIALRDLQDGVGDLSAKLSHLRETTRRDSMKRASLQRLKTPSPFTSAQDWADPQDRTSKASVLSTDTAVRVNIVTDTPPIVASEFPGAEQEGADSNPTSSAAASFKSPVSQFRSQHGLKTDDSPLLPIHPKIRHIPPTPTTPYKGHVSHPSTDSSRTDTTSDSNAEPISPTLSDAFPAPPNGSPTPPRSRSGSIARSRSGSASQPNLPSHEDNPDAFDYSRFLLDSAMGTIKMNRERSPSSSSATTTSTTRPRTRSSARLSKASNVSGASRASTIKRVSLSPSRGSRGSSGSSGSTHSQQTLAQRRASTSGRSNSSASMASINVPHGRRSTSPHRASDASSPPTTVSPPPHSGNAYRPGHTRQLSTDSVSASSVASFATALERASSRLTIRSLSRSTLRNASAGGHHTNGAPIPTHRAGLEQYDASRSTGFTTGTSDQGDSPPRIIKSPRARSTLIDDGALAEAQEALRIPDTPTAGSLPASITKASAAILSAVLAVSHAAVREDDERRGNHGPARVIETADEEMLGRVLEGIIGAAVGLIGREDDGDGGLKVHGQKGNSWRESALPSKHEIEVDPGAAEQAKQIWRMRCEVARRALSEEKPSEGF